VGSGTGTPLGSSTSQAGSGQYSSWAVSRISPTQVSPGCVQGQGGGRAAR
jgi:hypothetical protein